MRLRQTTLVALTILAAAACSLRSVGCGVPPPPTQTEAQPGGQPPTPDTAAGGGSGTTNIVFLGDSLTAGLGLLTEQAYPHLIQQMFAAEGYDEVEAINAGISGDTTAGGVRRAEALLDGDARILILALGANDGLRGLTVEQTRTNLASIISMARSRGVAVLLCGMEAPTNYGEDYRVAFRGVFQQLASEYRGDISFVPFLLEGVAGNPALNQSDGVHPNAEGARVIANALYPPLRTMVDSLGNAGG
jgi:acyl-CoA thioesterase-1